MTVNQQSSNSRSPETIQQSMQKIAIVLMKACTCCNYWIEVRGPDSNPDSLVGLCHLCKENGAHPADPHSTFITAKMMAQQMLERSLNPMPVRRYIHLEFTSRMFRWKLHDEPSGSTFSACIDFIKKNGADNLPQEFHEHFRTFAALVPFDFMLDEKTNQKIVADLISQLPQCFDEHVEHEFAFASPSKWLLKCFFALLGDMFICFCRRCGKVFRSRQPLRTTSMRRRNCSG